MTSVTACIAFRFRLAAHGEDGPAVCCRTGQELYCTMKALHAGLPSTEFLRAFCLAYGVSPDWLIFERGPSRLSDIDGARQGAYATALLTADLLRGRVAPSVRLGEVQWMSSGLV